MKGTYIGVGIISVIVAIAVIGIFTAQIPDEPAPYEPEWIHSGPFSINKAEYRIGEKIAYSINGLQEHEIGEMYLVSPEKIIVKIQPFNGSAKCCFNQYYEPDTSRLTGLYKVSQLIGTWTVAFEGVDYTPIEFEVTSERVPGSEDTIYDLKSPMPKNETG